MSNFPGLEHLLAVLKFHGIDIALRPPLARAPRAGDQILGEPFDPMLAAVHARHNGGLLGDLGIFSTDDPEYGIAPFNEMLRSGEDQPLQKVLCYGGISGLAFYFA